MTKLMLGLVALVLASIGADTVRGRRARERRRGRRCTITGGGGRDRLVGGTGNDVIEVRDGKRDVVDCGPGRDRVRADKKDKLADCEVRLR